MTNKMKIIALELEIKSGNTVKLTISEAKVLYMQLHELFGDKTLHLPSQPGPIVVPWQKPIVSYLKCST